MVAAHSRAARPRRQHALVALLSLASGLVPVLAPWWATPAAATPNTTQLISVATSGTQGTQDAGGGFSLSAGGRFVAFDSYATNLMTGMTDGNNGRDIFVRDRVANTTELISIATTGGFGDGESADPDVSADGRYVAFTSWASNLVPGDTNGAADVFVRDRLTGTTERVSVSTAGAQGNQGGYGPRITPDGRYVVFGSDATNLVSGDTNGWTDTFLRDRVAGTTERISVSTGGAQGDHQSGWPAVSADGRFVAFMSGASTLVAGDTNANWDIFVRDRNTSTTERVSVANSSGAQGDSGSGLPSISADGRYVVFYSVATNLVTGDTNGADDVFLRDRSAGTTQRISVGPGGVQGNGQSLDPNISRDGRYITYSSVATNLVSGDTNAKQDEFLYDRLANTTELVSVSSAGGLGDQNSAGRAAISAEGRYVAYWSRATTLVTGDTNTKADTFVRERDPQQAPLIGAASVSAEARRGGGSPSMLLGCPSPTADPCDVSTGNFSETTTDISIPGRGMGLDFTRTYNSYPSPAAPADGPLGYGWSFNYGMSITTGTNPTITEENGAQITFTGSGVGFYTPPARVIATLEKKGDNTWEFIRKAQEIYTFNASGQLTSVKDRNGHTTTLTYSSGKLTTVTDPAGRTLTMGWTGSRITSVTDTASPARSVTFSYDGSGNLTEVVDIGGGHTQYGYDANHRMTLMRSPNYFPDGAMPSPVANCSAAGPTHTMANHYDGSGRIDCQYDPLGRKTSFAYTSNATTVTDPKGNVRVDTFSAGLLTSRTLGSGTAQAATWTYGYDPATLARTFTVDPNGGVTTTIHDGLGNALMTIDELGRTTVTTYDSLRQPVTVRDPMDVTTTYDYDGVNLEEQSTPLVGTASTKTTSYTIDTTTSRKGDILSVTDPDGKVWPRTWDSDGNLSTEADPLGNTTRYCYDTVGRKTKEISPKGTAAGVTCSTSSPTFTTLFTNDAFGDPLVVTDPLGHGTIYEYDANRNRTSLTDANGHTTTWIYDAADQLIKEIRPGGGGAGASGIEAGQSTSDQNAAPATTLVLDTPAGVDEDDVMVAGVAVRGAVTVTAPSGWELIRSDSNGSSMKLLSYFRVATDNEDPDYTWSFSSAKAAAGTITAYSGVDTDDPVDVDNGLAELDDTATIIAPSVTTTEANDRIIGLFAIMKATTITEPSGMTPRGHATSSGGGEPPVTIASADTTQATPNATGAKTATAAVADRNTGQLIALRPADDSGGGSGEITVPGWTAGHNEVTTTLVLDKPTGTDADDVLIAGVATRGTPTVTAPTGWELIHTREAGSSWTLQSYYKIAGGSEPSDYTWTLSEAKAAAGTITAYRGVNNADPIDVSNGAVNSTDSTSITAPAVTTSDPNEMLVGLFMNDGVATITEPTGMTPRGEDTSNVSGQAHVTIASADAIQQTDGNTGTKVATASSAVRSAAELIALNPAPGDASSLRYEYNADGTLWRAFNGANETTTYGYDAQARMTSVTDPLSRTTTYGYDPAGNRTTKQDPGGNCSTGTGCTTTRYNLAGQITRIDYSDSGTPDVTLIDYDLNGRRTKMTDGTGTSTWTWDSLGRLTSNKNGNNQTVGYEYDLRGNNKKIIYPGTTGSVIRTFDNASRLWKVKDWLNNESVFTYDANSFITKWDYPNGTTATYTPDAAGETDTISHAPTSTPLVPFASFDYGRDPVGQVTSVTSTGVPTDNHTYTYTPLGQLATDNGNPYSYDAADNVTGFATGATLAYDDADQLTSMTDTGGTTSYGFDNRGNRTSVTPPGGPAVTLTYNQANRLKTYGSTASYTYDGDGTRMSKTVAGTSTAFTLDDAGKFLVDGVTNYIYGPDGRPLEKLDSNVVTYYHHDATGSTRALSDSNGAVLGTATYDPLGNVTASTGVVTRLGYSGRYRDAETGFLFAANGYYDPVTGTMLGHMDQGAIEVTGENTATPDDIYLSPSDPYFSHDGNNGRFTVQFDYSGRSMQWSYQLHETTYANAAGKAKGKGSAVINGKKTRYHYSKSGVSPGYLFHSSIGRYQNTGDAPHTSHRLHEGDEVLLNIEITYKTSHGSTQHWWVQTRVHL